MIWQRSQLEEALCHSRVGGNPGNYIFSGLAWPAPGMTQGAGKIQFNSKDVEPGDLFIALKGENGSDGHKYAGDALKRGAALVIIEKAVNEIDMSRAIKVPDTYEALLKLADYKRQTSKAKFIGITGSSGKTSTKESTKIILEAFGKTFASRGNFNNHLGVPINLASMPDDIDYAVIEMGMNHKGEISKLTHMVRPDIALITNVSPAHLQFFKSVEEIADAKSEIFEGLKEGGLAIINRDSPYFERICSNAASHGVTNIKTFGTRTESDSRLECYEVHDRHCEALAETIQEATESRYSWTVTSPLWATRSDANTNEISLTYKVLGKEITLTRSMLPEHFAHNIAASLLVAAYFGNDIEKTIPQINKIEVPKGRGDIIQINRSGIKNTIICDHYNANPESVKAALKYLSYVSRPNKVIILGDMRELGDRSQQFHEELAPFIIESGALKVLLIGEYSAKIADNLPSSIQVRTFKTVDQLIDELDLMINDGELILIKGSLSMNLKKIVDSLTEELS